MNTVITIGRQYGSGGREIGKMVAEKLGIPYFDKELLARVAKESGFCEEFLFHDCGFLLWYSYILCINFSCIS